MLSSTLAESENETDPRPSTDDGPNQIRCLVTGDSSDLITRQMLVWRRQASNEPVDESEYGVAESKEVIAQPRPLAISESLVAEMHRLWEARAECLAPVLPWWMRYAAWGTVTALGATISVACGLSIVGVELGLLGFAMTVAGIVGLALARRAARHSEAVAARDWDSSPIKGQYDAMGTQLHEAFEAWKKTLADDGWLAEVTIAPDGTRLASRDPVEFMDPEDWRASAPDVIRYEVVAPSGEITTRFINARRI